MFTLPDLPYSYDALEPFIDSETMHLHHDKHHQAYVDKLNAALEGHKDLQEMKVEELLRNIKTVPEDIRQAVINHGGGHYNHSMFWEIMGPANSNAVEAGRPTGKVKEEIEKVWKSFDKFKEEFNDNAGKLFGSGWTYLAADENGTNFHIHNHPNQENPLLHNHIPVLGLDVWEHAYYKKYGPARADYIKAWWNVVNWEKVEENFSETK
jgi:superoxide dismutase, Fe-Mn family